MSTLDDYPRVQTAFDGVTDFCYRYPTIILAAVLLISPFTFIGFTTMDIMTWLLPVIGLNVLVGFTGYLSFGQALYFGLGAYITALTAAGWNFTFIPAVLSGIIAGTAAALIVGLLSLRRRGIYFALLTLAFAQLGWISTNLLEPITGGTTGLGFDVPPAGLGFVSIPIESFTIKFAIIFVVVVAMFRMSLKIVRSPFGQIMKAVRENEERVAFLGYRTFYVKVLAFTIAGFYAAVGGAMFAIFTEFVFLDLFFWEISGDFLMITLIGGIGTMTGPLVGTYIFIVLRDFLSLFIDRWLLILGMIFVVIVLLAPEGIIGTINERIRK
ncbi:MAG: branched-chain amino acid ABC transporter permease [Salinirussus sp.]